MDQGAAGWKGMERRAQELKWSGDYAGALKLRQEIERIHDGSGAAAREQVKNLNYMAHVAVHARALDEAERAARKCLAIYHPLAGDRDSNLATYLFMLAAALAEGGKFEEATTYGEEAVALFEQIHGEGYSFVAYRRMDVERMHNRDVGPYLDRS